MNRFECQTCCETYDISRICHKKITCNSCNYISCNHCQKRYEKAECMNCHVDYTKNQIETLLGKSFVKNVIIRRIIENLIIEEKQLLPATEELIKYNNEMERRRKLFRQGKQVFENMPATPVLIAKKNVEPCTMTGCKGYLKMCENTMDLECMMCKSKHCIKCQVVVTGTDHECNKDTLETIKQLEKDTRRCPKCYHRIHKISGCDHMRCTSCGAHFSWDLGVLLKNSTNHHYNVIRNQSNNDDGMCYRSYADPAIPQDILQPHISDKIVYDLYTYPNKIRYHYTTNCQYNTILQKRIDANNVLRIKYMNNEIEEHTWGKRLYNNYKTMKMKLAHREIIEMYLSCIDDIQSRIYNNMRTEEDIHNEVLQLIKQCNECFETANDEFYCETTESRFSLAIPDGNDNKVILEQKIIKSMPTPTKTAKDLPTRNIDLLEYQNDHYLRICDILNQHRIAFDLSPMGAGKTYITCKYMQTHPCDNMYIICPPMLKSKWIKVTSEYGIPAIIYTYNEIGGTKLKQPNHNMLRRDDLIETQQIHNGYPGETRDIEIVRYYATDYLMEMASKPGGLFVAFDEIQCLRNESSNATRACRAIMNTIWDAGVNCMLFISGTPFDKEKQFVTMYRNIGIQKSPQLYEPLTGSYTGYKEILSFVDSIVQTNKQKQVVNRDYKYLISRNIHAIHKVLFDMFLKIFKPILTSTITMPNVITVASITNQNVFYDLHGQDKDICEKSITKMLEIIDNNDNVVGQARIELFKSMVLLESAKINTFAEEVHHVLSTIPNAKVVVALSYSDSIHELANKLTTWNPLILNGDLSRKNKDTYISLFQQPSTARRLLIGNINVISTGIDLDDKNGNYPRYVFVNPNFSMITLQQLSYRFLRSLDTKSHTIIRYVYSSTGMNILNDIYHQRYIEVDINDSILKGHHKDNAEKRIINALINKSSIIKSISEDAFQLFDTYKSYRKTDYRDYPPPSEPEYPPPSEPEYPPPSEPEYPPPPEPEYPPSVPPSPNQRIVIDLTDDE